MKFYYVRNIFGLHIFDNETTAFLKFFEHYTEMHLVSLLFLNEKNITASLLIIHLKCTVTRHVLLKILDKLVSMQNYLNAKLPKLSNETSILF